MSQTSPSPERRSLKDLLQRANGILDDLHAPKAPSLADKLRTESHGPMARPVEAKDQAVGADRGPRLLPVATQLEVALASARQKLKGAELRAKKEYYGLDDLIRFTPWAAAIDEKVWNSQFGQDTRESLDNLDEDERMLALTERAERELAEFEGQQGITQRLREVVRAWRALIATDADAAIQGFLRIWTGIPRPEVRQPLLRTLLEIGESAARAHECLAVVVSEKPFAFDYELFLQARRVIYGWKRQAAEDALSLTRADEEAIDKVRARLEAGALRLVDQLYHYNLRSRVEAFSTLKSVAEGLMAIERLDKASPLGRSFPTVFVDVPLHDDEVVDSSAQLGVRIKKVGRSLTLSSEGLLNELFNGITVELCRASRSYALSSQYDYLPTGAQRDGLLKVATLFGASEESARTLFYNVVVPLAPARAYEYVRDIYHGKIDIERRLASKELSSLLGGRVVLGMVDGARLRKPLERPPYYLPKSEFEADFNESY